MNDDLSSAQHQALREMLGSYALGHLTGEDAATCRAHLEECAECRGELAEIGPLTELLSRLDHTTVESLPPTPPAGLGADIRARILSEKQAHAEDQERDELALARAARNRRRTSTWRAGVAAAVVLAIVGVGGGVIGRATGPEQPTIPREDISLVAASRLGDQITIDDAFLVPHTWGVELRIEATGFTEGEVFRAAFRNQKGRWIPAGEFLGVGANSMVCNLQASALRDKVTEVAVLDADGEVVLSAQL